MHDILRIRYIFRLNDLQMCGKMSQQLLGLRLKQKLYSILSSWFLCRQFDLQMRGEMSCGLPICRYFDSHVRFFMFSRTVCLFSDWSKSVGQVLSNLSIRLLFQPID